MTGVDANDGYEYNERFVARECPNGHLTYPGHELCPDCGEPQETSHDLSERTGEVVTWTTSTATPTGVREPNHLAIVEFAIEETSVRALGQLTTGDVAIGDAVRPVHVEQLREPGAGIREADSQRWDGYRFEPVEE